MEQRGDARSTTAAFAAPLAGQWGNAGRDTIPGPTAFSPEWIAGPHLPLRRAAQRRLAIRGAECAEPCDHHQLGHGPSGSTNYGLATSAAAMRNMTVTLRFRF